MSLIRFTFALYINPHFICTRYFLPYNMSLFVIATTLIDRYRSYTRRISIRLGKLQHGGHFTTIPNSANDLSAAHTHIEKLLPGIRKCMLIAVTEISMISWCTTYAVLPCLYFSPDAYFMGDIFSCARFPDEIRYYVREDGARLVSGRCTLHRSMFRFARNRTNIGQRRFFEAPQGIQFSAALQVFRDFHKFMELSWQTRLGILAILVVHYRIYFFFLY